MSAVSANAIRTLHGRAAFSSVRGFFFNPKNQSVRFVGKTKTIDKILKCTKATAELTGGILQLQGAGGAPASIVAANVAGAVGEARTVLGLFNVYHGIIPVTVRAVNSCFANIKQLCVGADLSSQEKGWLGLDAVKEAGTAILGLSVIGTFGVSRPVLFANKLADKPFLDKVTQAKFKESVPIMMAIGHAGGLLSGSISTVMAAKAYRDKYCGQHAVVPENDEQLQIHRKYLKAIKLAFLSAFEKFFELLADLAKLIPLGMSATVQGVIASALVVSSCCVGLYRAWTTA